MPLFTYRAINDDNKEVRGTIDAPDVSSARQAVENMHLEVLDVSESSRTIKKDVFDRLFPFFGGLDQNVQIFFNFFLARK